MINSACEYIKLCHAFYKKKVASSSSSETFSVTKILARLRYYLEDVEEGEEGDEDGVSQYIIPTCFLAPSVTLSSLNESCIEYMANQRTHFRCIIPKLGSFFCP